MSPNHHPEERDDLGPLSPDLKRRRYNGEHQPSSGRPMGPRYVTAPPGIQAGPGTPFPFPPGHPHNPYPHGAAPPQPVLRRESLPGLRGAISVPGPMAPPPRPGPGYQQHRMSQGHNATHDRSLTLPPLQTNNSASATPAAATSVSTPATGKSAKDQIMTLEFFYKVKVLSQVSPPAPIRKSAPRGPLVAIEGDNYDAVRTLGAWLTETLGKGDDLSVKQIQGPVVSSEGSKQQIMARYHHLAADWLLKSDEIVESLQMKITSPTDSVMVDASATPKPTGHEIDENYSDSEEIPRPSNRVVAGPDPPQESNNGHKNSDAEKMDVDNARKASTSGKGTVGSASSGPVPDMSATKPVKIIANYSLFASNFFSCHIPTGTPDRYSPKDHWEWNATLWRGIVSPDLTIYVRDAPGNESSKPIVEGVGEGNLFVVKRTKVEGKEGLELEASVLRRLGFEVSEWVRGFGEK